jgi:hypothetical protein
MTPSKTPSTLNVEMQVATNNIVNDVEEKKTKGRGRKRARDSDSSSSDESQPAVEEEQKSSDDKASSKRSKTSRGSRAVGRAKKQAQADLSDADEDPVLRSKRDRNKMAAAKYRNKKKKMISSVQSRADKLERTVRDQSEQMNKLLTENQILKSQLDTFKEYFARFKDVALPTVAPGALTMFVFFAALCLFSPLHDNSAPIAASRAANLPAPTSRRLFTADTIAIMSPSHILLDFEAHSKTLIAGVVAQSPGSASASSTSLNHAKNNAVVFTMQKFVQSMTISTAARAQEPAKLVETPVERVNATNNAIPAAA